MRSGDKAALAATFSGLLLFCGFALLSKGFYHGDDCWHFLIAHDARHSVLSLMHWWGRPGYTLPAMLADTAGGLAGCRLLSAAMTALTAFLAYRIAVLVSPRRSRFLWLAPILVWLQPLPAILAQTTLTETPAALYLALCVWLWLRGNRLLSCLAASLLFVTRYETLALAPILAGAVLHDAYRHAEGDLLHAIRLPRVWLSAGVAALFPALYLGAAALLDIPKDISPLGMFGKEYYRGYGHGSWFHFWPQWVVAAGGGVLALAAAGVVRLRSRAALPAAFALGLFLLHTLIFRMGALSSAGYARFLVPASGLLAALAAAGVHGLFVERRRPAIAAAFLVLALTAAAFLGRAELAAIRPGLWAALAILAALAALTPALRSPGSRAAAARAAGALCLSLVLVHAAAVIRPLTLAESLSEQPESGVVRDFPLAPHGYLCFSAMYLALEDVRASSHAGARLFSTHGFVRCHALRAEIPDVPEPAIEAWRGAAPGSVFLWESDNGADGATEAEPRGPLFAELERTGSRLSTHRVRDYEVVVFVRGEG